MITYNSMIEETEVHKFTAFASDLYNDVPDLRIRFPSRIKTSIGNKQPLIAFTKKIDSEGGIQYVRYVQRFGIVNLIVYNT